jgi:hypothetical protein
MGSANQVMFKEKNSTPFYSFFSHKNITTIPPFSLRKPISLSLTIPPPSSNHPNL